MRAPLLPMLLCVQIATCLDVRPSNACPYDAVSLSWFADGAWGVALYDDPDAPDTAYLARIPSATAVVTPSLPKTFDEQQAEQRRREREAQPTVPAVGCAHGGSECEAPKLLSLGFSTQVST